MSNNINEVRERLQRACIAGMDAEYVDDVSALLDDHARLQSDAERLDWLESTVHDADIPGAVQLYFGPYGSSTLRAAIDAAKAVQP